MFLTLCRGQSQRGWYLWRPPGAGPLRPCRGTGERHGTRRRRTALSLSPPSCPHSSKTGTWIESAHTWNNSKTHLLKAVGASMNKYYRDGYSIWVVHSFHVQKPKYIPHARVFIFTFYIHSLSFFKVLPSKTVRTIHSLKVASASTSTTVCIWQTSFRLRLLLTCFV